MRDGLWLQKQLDHILATYFGDMLLTNPLKIEFGREAKYRFGSIKLISDKETKRQRAGGFRNLIKIGDTPKMSLITITKMFSDERVPEEVVQYTIGHELCHYAHGFSSMNKRLFKHPHHGGVINQELRRRGATHLIVEFKKWLRIYRRMIMEKRAHI